MKENIIPCPLPSELLGTPCHTMVTLSTEGSFQTPVNDLNTSLADNCRILGTSPHALISSLDTLAWDSGFGTFEIDDTQNSSVGLDSSFQELLLHSTSRNKENLNQAKSNRGSRLEHRTTTLQDEGSILKRPSQKLNLHLATSNPRSVYIREKHDDLFLEKTAPETSTDADLSLVPALQMVYAMFRQSVMLAGKKDLEELLKSSEPLRMTMPLMGLIGRKMGLERLDILTELKKINLGHIFAMILNQLSCGRCMSGTALRVPDADTRLALPCRSALLSVQAQAKTRHHTPLSRNGSFTIVKHGVKHSGSKRKEILQVAKTLFSDECLRSCPRSDICKCPKSAINNHWLSPLGY
ncbi:hypothetical protein SKAU_G00214110 [Synaphobranchus kaupii]|uniref:Uncharacterized protein n=1 Tax=Synaphobranchus kaupii TaxID=118154 RepID=A0A9Q1F9C5_SYNKA|nr:hypothetical protein SKAU_G00214110 [Synaphobranchus kaupii]